MKKTLNHTNHTFDVVSFMQELKEIAEHESAECERNTIEIVLHKYESKLKETFNPDTASVQIK